MKNPVLVCVFITILMNQKVLFGQQPLDEDLYLPIPLQTYIAPKDASYTENKLVVFNMLEKKFDTIHTESFSSNYKNKRFPSGQSVPRITNWYNGKHASIFSVVQPADQLMDFPDYPISSVVKLFITFFNPKNNQSNFATCSGVLISPGFILTGAHCVKSKFDSSYAVACTVVPAYNLGKRPFGLTTTTNWYALTQWTQNGNLDYDIAIMSLANPIGNSTGWLELSYQANDSFFTDSTNVFYSFGYPGSDPLGNPVFEQGERMYYMNGYMDYWLNTNTMCHRNIGYSGQSGSGLQMTDSANKTKVYGVLSNGNLFPPYYTCHCRLDSSTFHLFNNIIQNASEVEENNFHKEMIIYPNPSNGIFQIDLSQFQSNEIHLQVFDVLGQQIINQTINPFNSIANIDLSLFPSGTYFIKARVDGKSMHGRILKAD